MSFIEKVLDAASTGDLATFRVLLAGAEFTSTDSETVKNDKGENPVHLSAKSGHVEVLNHLFEAEKFRVEDTDGSGRNALYHACAEGHLNVVKRLLQCSKDEVSKLCSSADVDSQTALHCAAQRGFKDIVECLLEVDTINMNAGDWINRSALHYAAHNGHLEVVRMLLKHPSVDATLADNEGRLPLHLACEEGRVAVVDVLLSHGDADPSCTDGFENTPLHLACDNNHTAVAERLLKEPETAAECQNEMEQTPLHLAAQKGSLEIVEKLLETGEVDVNCPDDENFTALHFAVEKQHEEVAMRLLDERNIDLSHANDEGDTPVHLALLFELSGVFSKMLRLGAKINTSMFNLALSKPHVFPSVQAFEDFQVKFLSENANFIKCVRLSEIKELSSGNFGITYRANLLLGSTVEGDVKMPVVLKVAKGETGSDEWHELRALKDIPPSPYVVSLLGICTDFALTAGAEADTAMVLPFLKGGGVRSHLDRRSGPLSTKRTIELAIDMTKGVMHLHAHGYKHNDISARNFLLLSPEGENDDNCDNQRILLTDFGLTRKLSFQQEKLGPFPWRWVAPETLASGGRESSAKSDIWMLGIAMYELVAPKLKPHWPVMNPGSLLSKYQQGSVPLQFPKWTHEDLKSLILSCCSISSDDRPTGEVLLEKLIELRDKIAEELKTQAGATVTTELTAYESDDDYASAGDVAGAVDTYYFEPQGDTTGDPKRDDESEGDYGEYDVADDLGSIGDQTTTTTITSRAQNEEETQCDNAQNDSPSAEHWRMISDENRRLKEENAALNAKLAKMNQLEEELKRLRDENRRLVA